MVASAWSRRQRTSWLGSFHDGTRKWGLSLLQLICDRQDVRKLDDKLIQKTTQKIHKMKNLENPEVKDLSQLILCDDGIAVQCTCLTCKGHLPR